MFNEQMFVFNGTCLMKQMFVFNGTCLMKQMFVFNIGIVVTKM